MNVKLLSGILILFSIVGGMLGGFLLLQFLGTSMQVPSNGGVVNTVQKNIQITDLENTITGLVKQTSPSVVSIIIKKDLTLYRSDVFGFFQEPVGTVRQKVGGGTGFFITKDGKIITNKHVVADEGAEYVVITNDGKEFEAQVLARDPLTDLAVIQIQGKKDFVPLTFVSKTDGLNIGEFAVAIGNALAEFQNSVSFGVISGKNRSISDQNVQLSGLIQTDAAINPGNSGGPLLNLDAKVIGINTAIVNGSEGLGFALALNKEKVDFMLNSIKKYGEIKKPFIGIGTIALSPKVSEKLGISLENGALISDEAGGIVEGSPAQKAGLEVGDIITKIDGETLDIRRDLPSMIQNTIPGDTITLEVVDTKGNTKEVKVILGEK